MSRPPRTRRLPLGLACALAALTLLMAACASAPFPPEQLGQVNPQVGMAQLIADPQAYVGQSALLGGYIIQATNLPQATEIEVLQSPLNGDYRPTGAERSQGRFLVRLKGFADPAVYARGRPLTVIGRVAGSELRPVGQVQYRYPVLEAVNVHLWQEREQYGYYPAFTFGIGVGTFF